MKAYVVASDIHGSLEAAQCIIEAFNKHRCEGILLLGDSLYHGPRNPLPDRYQPKEVALLLNQYKQFIISVRGNCDSEVDQMVLEFPTLANYSYFNLGDHRLFLSHGHLYPHEPLPFLREGDLYLAGHTHIPIAKEEAGIYLLNPGSLSLPKGGHEPSYAILDEQEFQGYSKEHQKNSIHISFQKK